MVDFRQRLVSFPVEKHINPLDIYERLDRASDKGPLRPAQIAVLQSWYDEYRLNRDVILKLNTGQGKTLVGLLMLQSKMNENEGSALYLCPNNMLVTQTLDQARQFGIVCTTTTDDLPSDFLDGKSILITSIHKLFNGLSKFKLGPHSIKVDNIVIDDAHACIGSIKDSYTISLSNEHPVYSEILALFSTSLDEQGAGTCADIHLKNYGAFLPVPYWDWIDKNKEVVTILANHAADNEIKFAWPLIKDILTDCLCVISGTELSISPYRPPLQLFGSYYKAKHRIFMSATITDDSFLIKGLGLSEEVINKPLVYKDEKWSGEKMIIIPSLIHSSLDDSEIVDMFAKPSPNRNIGIVVLCPSFVSAKIWQAAGAHVANTIDIQSRVEMLRDKKFSDTLVAVNRYDGIDLPDDVCRILIVDTKPFSEDLLDRYIEACREGSEVISVKTARTIEQGLGRSVRGEKDFSVIILIGNDLIRCVKSKEARRYFSAQTREQIEMGIEVAKLAQDDITDETPPKKVFRMVMMQCLMRDEGWKEYYIQRMDKISQSHQPSIVLDFFSAEMRAENKYYEGEYKLAAAILQEIIDNHNLSISDKGWYLQEIARYLYKYSRTRSNELQIAAHKLNKYLLKPLNGMIIENIIVFNQKRIEKLIFHIKELGSFEELTLFIDELLGRLRFGVRADAFEKALNDLAFVLGFEGQRPDKEWKAGPDNLWGLKDDLFLLFECKSEVSLTRAEINKDESGQMNNSIAWFRKHYLGAKVKCILVIPTKTLSKGAGFNDDVEIMREFNLQRLTINVKAFTNEFRDLDFSSLSETKVQGFINTHQLDIESIVSVYSEKPKSL